MSKIILLNFALLATLLLQLSFSQSKLIGKCELDSVPLQPDLDVAKFAGTWWEIYRYPFPFELNMKCVKNDHVYGGPYSNLTTIFYGTNRITQFQHSMSGELLVNTTAPARLSVKVPPFPPAPYYVVSTDYNNYAAVYSCTQLGLLEINSAWILSRNRTASNILPDRLDALFALFDVVGLNREQFEMTDQLHCPY